MWALLAAGVTFIGAIVFGMAKASSRGEKITESHREELLARKNGKEKE